MDLIILFFFLLLLRVTYAFATELFGLRDNFLIKLISVPVLLFWSYYLFQYLNNPIWVSSENWIIAKGVAVVGLAVVVASLVKNVNLRLTIPQLQWKICEFENLNSHKKISIKSNKIFNFDEAKMRRGHDNYLVSNIFFPDGILFYISVDIWFRNKMCCIVLPPGASEFDGLKVYTEKELERKFGEFTYPSLDKEFSHTVLKNNALIFQENLYSYFEDFIGYPFMEALEQKAKRGEVEAQVNLGFIYHQRGFHSEAQSLYEQASEKGFAPAKYNLALLLAQGDGIIYGNSIKLNYDDDISNTDIAILLEDAAKQGYVPAQYQLALMKLDGVAGINVDDKWLNEASEQGYAPAENALNMKDFGI